MENCVCVTKSHPSPNTGSFMKIPVSKPDISEKEIEYVNKALRDGWISSKGPHIPLFEDAFSKRHGKDFGVASSSGTNAIFLALKALGIKEGDEVIVPEFTMIATAWAVSYTGATPIFVDCGDDLNIDVSKIEEKITPRTKAIIPVHIYGRQCDMTSIMRIAHDYNLYVVEDSCEAHGIIPRGDIACFSLFANKIITSGEGGICVTDNIRLAEQMVHYRSMAFDEHHTFLHKKIGYNFRMTNLQAAVALAQTERLNELLAKRKQIEEWYNLPQHKPTQVLWMYDIEVENRDGLMKHLADRGIETRLFFKPMSMQPMYKGEYKHLKAYEKSLRGLYLPTYSSMTRDEVDYVRNAVLEFSSSG